MKTKDKIIAKAIEMYNAKGISNVSSRNISNELGISHGNLEYHFKNKAAILDAIYDKMRSDISNVYEDDDLDKDPFEHFQSLLNTLENFQNNYLFFNLDLLEISRKFPEVKSKLDKTLILRRSQTETILKRLIQSEYFNHELEEGYYMRLQHMIRILITFWKLQEEILVSFSTSGNNVMSLHVWDLLTPHMTNKGIETYSKLIKNNHP